MRTFSVEAAVLFALCVATSLAQGPPPPRLNIPGAVPVGVPQRSLGGPGPGPGQNFVRVRRPLARPFAPAAAALQSPPPPSYLDEGKPVTESSEDDGFLPHHLSQQSGPKHSLFAPEPNSLQQQQHHHEDQQQQQQQQQQSHPQLQSQPQHIPRFAQPEPQQFAIPQRASQSGERFLPELDHQPAPKQQARPRPVLRDQNRDYQEVRPLSEPRQTFKVQQHQQPQQKTVQQQNNRDKKPVAQILRKYREENEDGSITWGFENDDGSYKEEIIGINCVTRGRYGYVDPDGLKREYTYETGILCDPNRRDQEESAEQEGYVDYQENQAVLPNGSRINLGNTKAKRPGQGQQLYRN